MVLRDEEEGKRVGRAFLWTTDYRAWTRYLSNAVRKTAKNPVRSLSKNSLGRWKTRQFVPRLIRPYFYLSRCASSVQVRS